MEADAAIASYGLSEAAAVSALLADSDLSLFFGGEKEEDKQTKKQYCPFHKRKTIHKPKDCFLNPKNKDKSESANKADTAAASDKP
jgi:hypothetical protein